MSLSVSYDFLYINNFVGEFPDLSPYKNARHIYIANCVFSSVSHKNPRIPDWFVSLAIERSVIFELPILPLNLKRLVVSHTTLYKLPNILPPGLSELILDHNPNITCLPYILPPELAQLDCINCGVVETPELPVNLYILRWRGNPATFSDCLLGRLSSSTCSLTLRSGIVQVII